MKGSLSFDRLENRISLNGFSNPTVTVGIPIGPVLAPVQVRLYQEPDPGSLPKDDQPIVYPPVDPNGPVGPGASLALGAHAIEV